mgnify:CR=1 FL=1
MTTLNSADLAARYVRSMRSVILTSVMALALAGCETGSNLLSGGGDGTAPQAGIVNPGTPPPGSTQTAKLEIAPVIGAPESVSRDLQAQLTTAIERNKISVARGPSGKGEYTLRGYVVAAREKSGSKISYIWDVTDQTGKRANRITGEELAVGSPSADPWSTVSPQIVQAIADKTAAQVATWYQGTAGVPVASNAASSPAPGSAAATTAATQAVANAAPDPTAAVAKNAVAANPTPAATTAALTPAAATTGSIEAPSASITTVPLVTGAPGDGSQSLTSAIQRELTKNGVALTNAPAGPAYKVEGKVVMGQGKDGKQPIQIDWNVLDPKGKKLGTVSQKNEVPQGSLDGTWGKTADVAAAAAAQGIVKLLPPSK